MIYKIANSDGYEILNLKYLCMLAEEVKLGTLPVPLGV